MAAKYKIEDKVYIEVDSKILEVEIFGCFTGQKGIVYSVKTSEGVILLQNEASILEKIDE